MKRNWSLLLIGMFSAILLLAVACAGVHSSYPGGGSQVPPNISEAPPPEYILESHQTDPLYQVLADFLEEPPRHIRYPPPYPLPHILVLRGKILWTFEQMANCSTPKEIIECFYDGKDTEFTKGICAEHASEDWNAFLPFGYQGKDTITTKYLCADSQWDEFCGCIGWNCFQRSWGNNRLSVELVKGKINYWRITFNPEITLNDIHFDESTCYTNNANLYCPDNSTPPGIFTMQPKWINKDVAYPATGPVYFIEFQMPPKGCVVDKLPDSQLCLWEIKMKDGTSGVKTYHEHFSTNPDCFGWVEFQLEPK